jgi:tetratricopeptide (TPR) repeat protein
MEWAVSYDLPRVDSLLRRVERFKTQLPPYDLAYFDYLRAYLDGDLEAVLRAARRRPDLLAGNAGVQASIRLNRLDTAYALITEVMKRPITQRHPISWQFLTQILHMRGEYDRELQEAQMGLAEMRSTASEPAIADLLGFEVRALAALGRLEDLRRALDEMHTLRDTSEVFASVTRELRWHGHAAAADVIGRVAEQWYRDALTRSSDRHVRLLLAQTLFYLERWNDARAVFDSLAAETLPAAFTSERGRRSGDLIPFAYIGIDDARRGDTSAANTSIARLGQFNNAYGLGEPSYYKALISAEVGQCDRAMAFLRESITRGNSVFDGLQLEALEFKRIERCTAFQDLRGRPYSSPTAAARPAAMPR